MLFLLVFNKVIDVVEIFLLFIVCFGFFEVYFLLLLFCKFSSFGWKYCSRYDLILFNILESDSLFL